ncbi:MAG: FliG C-terminal domain-containing protein [Pseudomonadota bacterium]
MSLPALSPLPDRQDGMTRSALLMRALGAKAASVWSELSPDEAEQLSAAMQALPDDANAEQSALHAYVQTMRQTPSMSLTPPTNVWAKLSRQEGTLIAGMVQGESPQVIALILSRLAPDAAANTVRALPRTLATDALKRLLNLGPIHPAALRAIERVLENSLTQSKSGKLAGGHEHVARIFDSLDSGSESTLLSSLDSAEPGAGEKIRALMFTFDDLAALDPGSLQTILGSIDRAVLTVALKGATPTVSDAFFKNVTQRAADLLREDIAAVGPVRRSEIDAARAEVLQVARALVKRGDLLPQNQDDELIE